jgi:hypothetical protein
MPNGLALIVWLQAEQLEQQATILMLKASEARAQATTKQVEAATAVANMATFREMLGMLLHDVLRRTLV